MPKWSGWDRLNRWRREKAKRKAESLRLIAVAKYEETLKMLEKTENFFAEKTSQEDKRAKEFTRAENRTAASQCLKRKWLYDQTTQKLGDCTYQIHDQLMRLVRAKVIVETVDTLRTGAAALEAMQKANNIADVNDVINDINGRHKPMEQIEEVLSASPGAAAFFDKDELGAQLKELGEADPVPQEDS